MLRKLRDFADTLQAYMAIALGCVNFVLIVYAFGKFIVEPLAPLVTTVLIIVGTAVTFKRWPMATLSITGLALYALSWPATAAWGPYPGVAVCMTGIFAWMAALSWAITPKQRPVEALVRVT